MEIRNIPRKLKDIANVQLMRRKVASQKGQITKLRNDFARLNHYVRDDILALIDKQSTYRGNAYNSYEIAVVAINDKYIGVADWGVLQSGNIIDLRAAFIIGEGPQVVKRKGVENADTEIAWAERFFEYNDIDNEVAQEFAKEAEIEGKLAIKLVVEEIKDATKEGEFKSMVSARYVSWTETRYKVTTNPQDYMQYEKLAWKPTNNRKGETLEEPNFVYKKFGGRINKPNEAAPKIMKCLTQIDNLDMALRDWREIDRVFAGPIMGVECKANADVTSAQNALADKNWKIDKVFISTSKLYYAQFDIKGVESLENEIITLSKMISGTTGIPVHFLGLPDLMSNRSVAENLMELIHASTSKERQIWIGAYEEMITKGMAMFNEEEGMTPLDPRKIGIEIPMITKEHWQHLVDFYLTAAVAGKISDEALLEQIPGLDIDKERKRKEEKETSELENVKRENKDLLANQNQGGVFGRGEE